MKKWVKKWLFGIEDAPEDTRPAYEALRHQGCIQAYKINNGYIMRVMSSDIYLHGERVPTLHFCKDHQEIADYIVAQATIQKLGAERQMELPLTGGQVGIATLATKQRI